MFSRSSNQREPITKPKSRKRIKKNTKARRTTTRNAATTKPTKRRHPQRYQKKAKTAPITMYGRVQPPRRQRITRAKSAPPRKRNQRLSNTTNKTNKTNKRRTGRYQALSPQTLDIGNFFRDIVSDTGHTMSPRKRARRITVKPTITNPRLSKLKKKKRKKKKKGIQSNDEKDDNLLMSCDDSFVLELLSEDTPVKRKSSSGSNYQKRNQSRFTSPRSTSRSSSRTSSRASSRSSSFKTKHKSISKSKLSTPQKISFQQQQQPRHVRSSPSTPQPQQAPTPIQPCIIMAPITPIPSLTLIEQEVRVEKTPPLSPFVVHQIDPSELHVQIEDNDENEKKDEKNDENENDTSAQAQYINFIQTVVSKRRAEKKVKQIMAQPRRKKTKINKATFTVIERIKKRAAEKIQKEKEKEQLQQVQTVR